MALVVALVVSFLNQGKYVDSLDYLYYDFLQRATAPGPADDIVIIAIDDLSLSRLGRWPWTRQVHAQLLEQLNKAKPRVLVYDVVFAEPNNNDLQGDQAFAQSLGKAGNVVLPIMLDEHSNNGQIVEIFPYKEAAAAAQKLGHVHVELDFDGVVRNLYVREGIGKARWNHVALEALLLSQPSLGQSYLPEASATLLEDPISYGIARENGKAIKFLAAAGAYRTISFADVIDGTIPLTTFKDQIVFVGATASALGDRLATPMSHSGLQLSGVEVNATLYENFRSQLFIQRLSDVSILIVHLLIALTPILIMPRLSPSRSLLVITALSVTILAVTAVTFGKLAIWVPVAPALLGLALLYIMFTWRRLVLAITFLEQESARLLDTIHQYNREKTAPAEVLQAYSMATRAKAEPSPPAVGEKLPGGRLDNELFGKTIDVIQRSNTEVQALQALFESTLLLLSDGVLVWDTTGQVLFVNLKFAQAAGAKTTDGLYQRNALDIFQEFELRGDESNWVEVISSCQSGHTAYSGELRNSKEQEFLLRIEERPLAPGSTMLLIACITEISDIKKAQRERSETIHFLSHDLRSPMVSILALIEKAKLDEPSGGQMLSLLSRMESYAHKNLQFAEKYLQLARLESEAPVVFEEHDLAAIIDNAIEHLYIVAHTKRVIIHFDPDQGINAEELTEDSGDWYLKMVPDLVERVVINLLENAIKYCPEGSRVDVHLRRTSSHILCRITDDGPGIPESLLPTLFSKFSRARHSADISGVGLGLRFVAVVMQRHHGEVIASNGLNGGACFELSFPI